VARYLVRNQWRFALAIGGFGLALACFAAPLARAVLPAAYAMTADLVALLCVGGAFLLALWTLVPVVTAADCVGALQATFVVQAIASVVGDLLLAPRLGALGVALASIGARALAFVVLTLLMRLAVGARLVAVLPLLVAGAAVTALLVLGGAAWLRDAVGLVLLLTAAGSLWWQRRRG
jgi:hypothetical protein